MIHEQVSGLMIHSELVGLSASDKWIWGELFPCYESEPNLLLGP